MIAKKNPLVGEGLIHAVNEAETGWGRGPDRGNPDWPHGSRMLVREA